MKALRRQSLGESHPAVPAAQPARPRRRAGQPRRRRAAAATTLDTVTVTGYPHQADQLRHRAAGVHARPHEASSSTGLQTVGEIAAAADRLAARRSTPSSTRPATSAIRRTAAASAPVRRRSTCATSARKRVLVLVDGMRWVNESSASGVSGSADLNTIPLAIVERIEVLEDGASAIYGSDAIAGVVNIITRRNFDGAQATLPTTASTEGDGDDDQADLAWGGSGERCNLFLSAELLRAGRQSARPIAKSRAIRSRAAARHAAGSLRSSPTPIGNAFAT